MARAFEFRRLVPYFVVIVIVLIPILIIWIWCPPEVAPDPVGVWNGRPKNACKYGIALCIGVNRASKRPLDILTATDEDVAAMEKLLTEAGFDQVVTMSDEDPTDSTVEVQEVRDAIIDAASVLKETDLFVLYYSGHGDFAEAADESSDSLVPAWSMTDDNLGFDKVSLLLDEHFGWGRVVVLSDSCYAAAQFLVNADFQGRPEVGRLEELERQWNEFIGEKPGVRIRSRSPRAIVESFWSRRGATPARVGGAPTARLTLAQTLPGEGLDDELKIRRIILTASFGEGTAWEVEDEYGVFTFGLEKVYDGGAYTGSYVAFAAAVQIAMNDISTPGTEQTMSTAYRVSETSPFARQIPFRREDPEED